MRGLLGCRLVLVALLLGLPTVGAQAPEQCDFGTPPGETAAPLNETFTLEAGTGNWTALQSTSGVGWHLTSHPGKNAADEATNTKISKGPRAYYGATDGVQFDYDSDTSPNAGVLISPAVWIPPEATDIQLHFNAKWEVEARDPRDFDVMQAEYTIDNGATWMRLCVIGSYNFYDGLPSETVCSNGSADGHICPQDPTGETTPIWDSRGEAFPAFPAMPGNYVRVRFTFDTIDSRHNEGMGLMIDDVVLTHLPATPPPAVPVLSPLGMVGLVAVIGIFGAVLARRPPRKED